MAVAGAKQPSFSGWGLLLCPPQPTVSEQLRLFHKSPGLPGRELQEAWDRTSCDLTSGIPECHFFHLLKDKQVTKASTDSRAQRISTLSFKGRTSKEFTAIFHPHYSSGNTLLSEPGYKASRNLRDLSASYGHSPITDSLGPSCSLYQEPFLSAFCDFSIL